MSSSGLRQADADGGDDDDDDIAAKFFIHYSLT